VGGALSEGGNLIAWLESAFRLPPIEEAETVIAGRAPDAGALTVLPFIAGERSPDWSPGARATIAGLTLATQPVDLMQAGMESVAYELRQVYDLMTKLLDSPDFVVASGAALAKSSVWRDIIAGVFEKPLRLSPELESSSRGAALLVLERLGVAVTGPALAELERVEPHPSAAYRKAMRRQQRLRRLLLA
jgi:gluconokinase